uniref:Uncharacterized protein n=1 Tax=Lactuca sativa TaxID=4236 RepID=A0A9R1X5J7_LACSA|nr:hypothetical protein LSAT_V11C600328030 [Lactuca sativa]
MDTKIPSASLPFMNQEFAKLDRFDGQNYIRWTEKVKFMLHVLKLAYVLDPKLALINVDPILEAGKTVDPVVISDLEKKRALHREFKELCVGYIKNSLSDGLYDLYVSVKDSFKWLNTLSISIAKLFQFGAIITKLPPSWKDFYKRTMHKSEDYSLDDLMKHLRIEEEILIREKWVKSDQVCTMYQLGVLVTLRDVLHVPTISKGLVFADKFDKGGFKMELEKGKIVITKGRRDVEFFEENFSRDDENSNNTKPTSTSREILPPSSIVKKPKRSIRARIEESFGEGFYSYLVEETQNKVIREFIFAIKLDDDLKTFTRAMTSRDAPLWREVINDEMDSIMGNGT